jgi:hypothetical protein
LGEASCFSGSTELWNWQQVEERRTRVKLKLSSPKKITWWIAVGLALAGIVLYLLGVTGAIAASWPVPLGFWVEFLAAALLAAATALPKL